MAEDIILRATGETGDLERAFEGAEDSVRRSMEAAREAVESLDVSQVAEALGQLGEDLGDGAREAAGSVEDLGARLNALGEAADAAAEGADRVSEAAEALDSGADAAADSVDALADAQDELTRAQREAADSSEEAADEARGVAEIMEKVSAATRNAADSGSEAGERIVRAMEAIARSAGDVREGVNAAELAFEELGGSPAEFIEAANNDFERSAVLLADLQKNVRQLGEEAFEGLSGFADRAAKVSQRMAELERIIERQGDQALPEVRRELDRLRGAYRKTFDEGARRAANLEAAIEENEDALKRMKLEARGSAGELVDLTEALRLRFPKAAKAIGGAVSALATFKLAFEGTRDFVEFLDRDLGVDVDGFVQKLLGVADAATEIDDATGTAAEKLDLLRARLNILAKSGGQDVSGLQDRVAALVRELDELSQLDPTTTSVRDLTAAFERKAEIAGELDGILRGLNERWAEFRAGQKKVSLEAQDASAALLALQERALGIKLGDTIQGFDQLSDAFRKLEEQADGLEGSPVLEQFGEEASQLLDTLRQMPDELAAVFELKSGTSRDDAVARLREMSEALGVVIDQQDEAAEAAQKAAEQTADAWSKAADSARGAWEKVVEALERATSEGEEGPDGSQLLADLDTARGRLADLERQRSDLLANPGADVDSDFDLFRQIGEARDEVRRLESEARAIPLGFDAGPAIDSARGAGDEVGRVLREALGSSGFVDAFRDLGPAVQQEVASLVSQLEGLISSGERLDPALIRSYADAIRQALGAEAAGAVSGLEGAFGGLSASSRSAVDQLLEIARAGREVGDGTAVAQQSVSELATAAGEGMITLSRTGETLAMIGENAGQSAEEVGRLRGEAEATQEAAGALDGSAADAAGGVEGLGESMRSAGEEAEGARIRIEGAGESVEVLRQGAEGIAGAAPAAADGVGQIASAAEGAAGPVAGLASAAEQAGQHLGATADAAERLAGAEGVAEKIGAMGAAAVEAAPGVAELATGAGSLAESVVVLGEEGAELPEILAGWAAGVDGLAEPLGQLNAGALAEHREAVEAIAVGYGSAGEKAAQLVGQAEQLQGGFEGLGGALEGFDQRLGSSLDRLGEMVGRLGEVGNALEGVSEQAELAGGQLERVASPESIGRVRQLAGELDVAAGAAGRLAEQLERAAIAAEDAAS